MASHEAWVERFEELFLELEDEPSAIIAQVADDVARLAVDAAEGARERKRVAQARGEDD